MEYIRTLTREFEVGDRAELRVDNRSGSVEVRGGDTRQVRVEAVVRLWADNDEEADEQAGEIGRGMQQEGKRITIRAPALPWRGPFFFGRGPRIDYVVTTPRATTLQITSRSGRVEVANIEGPLDIDARSGRVSVNRIGGSTTILSRSGGVHTESIAGPVTVESRTGGVQVRRCEGNVKVRSRSGSLRIEEVRGSLHIESRSGSLRYEGEVRGPFDIEIRHGSVLLAVDLDSTFFVDAETAHGSVRSDLPLRRGPGPDSPSEKASPTVRVRTRFGSIHIGPR